MAVPGEPYPNALADLMQAQQQGPAQDRPPVQAQQEQQLQPPAGAPAAQAHVGEVLPLLVFYPFRFYVVVLGVLLVFLGFIFPS